MRKKWDSFPAEKEPVGTVVDRMQLSVNGVSSVRSIHKAGWQCGQYKMKREVRKTTGSREEEGLEDNVDVQDHPELVQIEAFPNCGVGRSRRHPRTAKCAKRRGREATPCTFPQL